MTTNSCKIATDTGDNPWLQIFYFNKHQREQKNPNLTKQKKKSGFFFFLLLFSPLFFLLTFHRYFRRGKNYFFITNFFSCCQKTKFTTDLTCYMQKIKKWVFSLFLLLFFFFSATIKLNFKSYFDFSGFVIRKKKHSKRGGKKKGERKS